MSIVLLNISEGVATITLNNPAERNILTDEMVAGILGAMDTIEADPEVRAIIVTGAAPAFCAGARLDSLINASAEGLGRIYEGFLRIARSPLPTIAAVNGAAVGAGMNLALGCDVRVAATRAKFDTRFLDLGIHPGGGHTWMMRRIVGPQTAFAGIVFGQTMDAAEAERVGLVYKTVADEELLPFCTAMAARAAAAPRKLVEEIKASLVDMGAITDHSEAVQRELTPQVWSTQQPYFLDKVAKLQAQISSKK